MKKRSSTLVLLLIFFLGLCILLYPPIANWWNSRVQTRVITDYQAVMQNNTAADYTAYFEAADQFNHKLQGYENPIRHSEDFTDYNDQLRLDGTDIMAYIDIPGLSVELPIYHGTSSSVLSAGVGHVEGTSLPVGGKGTHCALSAHRGLPSSKLFSDLDKMKIGDLFTITVFDRLLTYQVDQIKIVLPEEVEEVKIYPNSDYVTLVTCTPYGINTHRLLVRGTRVDNVKVKPQVYVPNEANKVDPLIVTPIVAIPLLIVMFIVVSIKYRKR